MVYEYFHKRAKIQKIELMERVDVKLQKAHMLVELIDIYYQEGNSTGGCVHIILEDHNYGKDYAKSCLEYSKENGDFWGETISRLLLDFNEEEQEQIVQRRWEIYEQLY